MYIVTGHTLQESTSYECETLKQVKEEIQSFKSSDEFLTIEVQDTEKKDNEGIIYVSEVTWKNQEDELDLNV